MLVLDTSYSMTGQPIDELGAGLAAYARDVQDDDQARKKVDVSVVTFGGEVRVVQPFVSGRHFTPDTLQAGGGTPMGEAIEKAVMMLEQRKTEYKRAGVGYYRPWIFLITDGAPTDDCQRAASLIERGEREAKFAFFAVGVDGADFDHLKWLTGQNPPMRLEGLSFRELFVWLSGSQASVSRSRPGERAALPPVTWGTVAT